jgi:hypothetical protein
MQTTIIESFNVDTWITMYYIIFKCHMCDQINVLGLIAGELRTVRIWVVGCTDHSTPGFG